MVIISEFSFQSKKEKRVSSGTRAACLQGCNSTTKRGKKKKKRGSERDGEKKRKRKHPHLESKPRRGI
jgi:hypothetical protein